MSVSQIREYAEMQRNRGRAYSLMKVGDKQANLKRAIACYEKALQVYTREQYPKEWASLHYDIGNTYQNLPASGNEKSTNLQEAITHYENALQVHLLHDERWAIIHFRLGEAYYHLTTGIRQTNLERAIAAYRRSLDVYTRKNFPAQWAMTYLSIGEALRNLPEGNQQTNKQEAFTSYQNALQVYTRLSFPRQWAMTQRSLGDLYYSVRDETRSRFYSSYSTSENPPVQGAEHYPAYNTFPTSAPRPYQETEGRSKPDISPNLRDAILCYQGALQVYTREEYPVEWAATLYAFGNSYRSVHGDDQLAFSKEAIDCYQQVLQVYTLETAPLEWARTQWSLGDACMSVARDKGSSSRKLASTCYKQALKVYTQVDFPHEWSELQKNLQAASGEQPKAQMEEANVLRSAADAQFSRREYQPALQSYQEALRLYHQLGKRNEEAQVYCSMAEVHLARDKNHRKDAEQNYLFALSIFQQAGNVAGEASVLRRLGRIDQIVAQESYQQATDLLQREPRSPQIQQLLSNGDTKRETARQQYEQALNLYLNVGDNTNEDATRKALNEVNGLGEQRNAVQQRLNEQRNMLTIPPPPSESFWGVNRSLAQPPMLQMGTAPYQPPMPQMGIAPYQQRRHKQWLMVSALISVLVILAVVGVIVFSVIR